MTSKHHPKVYLFFGPPGSGKGDLSTRLSQELGIPHISSGNLLREECRRKTPLGKYFETLISKGNFPEDKYIFEILDQRIKNPDCSNGFILDGIPRTLTQSKQVDALFSHSHEQILIEVIIDEKTLIKRLEDRRVCCNCPKTYHLEFLPPKVKGVCDLCNSDLIQRSDDNYEVILHRQNLFKEKFTPMLEYYKGRENWVQIYSTNNPKQCFEDLLKNLNSRSTLVGQTP